MEKDSLKEARLKPDEDKAKISRRERAPITAF